jgi:hypothetical protein
MKIEIKKINNGLLVDVTSAPSAGDPLAQRGPSGVFFARDGTDAMGYIAEWVQQVYGFQDQQK